MSTQRSRWRVTPRMLRFCAFRRNLLHDFLCLLLARAARSPALALASTARHWCCLCRAVLSDPNKRGCARPPHRRRGQGCGVVKILRPTCPESRRLREWLEGALSLGSRRRRAARRRPLPRGAGTTTPPPFRRTSCRRERRHREEVPESPHLHHLSRRHQATARPHAAATRVVSAVQCRARRPPPAGSPPLPRVAATISTTRTTRRACMRSTSSPSPTSAMAASTRMCSASPRRAAAARRLTRRREATRWRSQAAGRAGKAGRAAACCGRVAAQKRRRRRVRARWRSCGGTAPTWRAAAPRPSPARGA